MVISAAVHEAAQWVPLKPFAKFAQLGSGFFWNVPVPQHTMPWGHWLGSSHCQSVSPAAQGVAMGSQAAVPIFGSQQCCVP